MSPLLYALFDVECTLGFMVWQLGPDVAEAVLNLDPITTPQVRQNFDSGAGVALFEHFLHHEQLKPTARGKFNIIMTGAMLMQIGATIRPDHFQHLVALASIQPKDPLEHCMLFHPDIGRLGSARAQYLAALSNYKPGVPRDFTAPSCRCCGKTAVDTKKPLQQCIQCESAYYCNQTCQKADFAQHRYQCIRCLVFPGLRPKSEWWAETREMFKTQDSEREVHSDSQREDTA